MENAYKDINDFSKISIPDNYSMVKIISYNVSLKNSINLYNEIFNITKYILTRIKGIYNDIICIQGIEDKYALYEFVCAIKKVSNKMNMTLHTVPDFEDIVVEKSNSYKSSFHLSWSHSKPVSMAVTEILSCLIISRYPIINYNITKLMDDINCPLILANININNTIITICNINLHKNIINIDKIETRKKELNKINNIVHNNKTHLKNNYSKYNISDIIFICGNFNIEEIALGAINKEYLMLIQNYRMIDIYRYMNINNSGFTNIHNKRTNYLMLKMTDDVYDENNEYNKLLQKIKSHNDMFSLLHKRYGTYFMNSNVNLSINYKYDFPIEIILMIKHD